MNMDNPVVFMVFMTTMVATLSFALAAASTIARARRIAHLSGSVLVSVLVVFVVWMVLVYAMTLASSRLV